MSLHVVFTHVRVSGCVSIRIQEHMEHQAMVARIIVPGTGAMTQRLRTLAILPEDTGLISSMHMAVHHS